MFSHIFIDEKNPAKILNFKLLSTTVLRSETQERKQIRSDEIEIEKYLTREEKES